MDREFSEFISKVLDNTDIVSLISHYVTLTKKGNAYWACCPFHHEKTPSFSVVADRQFFHCFGCGVGGNAITFVMKMENVEFIDALKILAERCGLEMPQFSYTGGDRMDKAARDALYALMKDAARHYHDNLSSPKAKRFTDYLAERKIQENMVKRFGLGCSLSYDEMPSFLLSKGYTLEQMKQVGLVEVNDGGKSYDVFGERLIYPIIDAMGRVIAFGGRTLEKNPERAKYRNSAQTVIFDKSNVIYGINLLKKQKAASNVDYVIMTEGYMDVISLHAGGFPTAVASMGTSLTTKQARQLKLYTDVVYISYDGDTAGQKATMRGLDILKETGLTVKVVTLPDGLDPDDVIKRGGHSAYKKLLNEAIPLTAYKIESLRKIYDVNDADERAKLAIEATRIISSLNNPIEQEQYLTYVAKMTGFSVDALKRQADLTIAAPNAKKTDYPKAQEQKRWDKTLEIYFSCLLKGYDFVNYDDDFTSAMPDDFAMALYDFCKRKGKNALRYAEAEFGGDELQKINSLAYDDLNVGSDEKAFNDVRKKLRITALENEKNQYLDILKTEPDNTDLLQKISDLGKRITELKHKNG